MTLDYSAPYKYSYLYLLRNDGLECGEQITNRESPREGAVDAARPGYQRVDEHYGQEWISFRLHGRLSPLSSPRGEVLRPGHWGAPRPSKQVGRQFQWLKWKI